MADKAKVIDIGSGTVSDDHRKAWRVNKKNVRRWREQSTDPNFEPTQGYLKSVVFVLTEHLLERRRWRRR